MVVETSKNINNKVLDLKAFVDENLHKIRECQMYSQEYNECKSIKGRIQQNYLDGEYRDCSKWKEDLKNCEKFWKDGDLKAAALIIHHENERLSKRLKSNFENDVWKRRSEPPSDWNAELPDWLQKRQEDAFRERINYGQYCVIF